MVAANAVAMEPSVKQYLCDFKFTGPFPQIDCVFSPHVARARVWKHRDSAEMASQDLQGHDFRVPTGSESIFRCRRLEMMEVGPNQFVFFCEVPEEV